MIISILINIFLKVINEFLHILCLQLDLYENFSRYTTIFDDSNEIWTGIIINETQLKLQDFLVKFSHISFVWNELNKTINGSRTSGPIWRDFHWYLQHFIFLPLIT